MMSTVPPDTHKISLKIIEAVKQHPVLYISEVRGSAVKLQEFRQKVWRRISDELRLDPQWVRLRWKNLRDTYCRILKYKNKTDRGARRKKWIFEDHLNFLKFPYEPNYQPQVVELSEDYVKEINAGRISSEGLLEQLEDQNDEDYTDYLEVLEETNADPIMGSETIDLDPGNRSIAAVLESQAIDDYARQIQSKFRKIRPKRSKDETAESNDYQAKSNEVNQTPVSAEIVPTFASETIKSKKEAIIDSICFSPTYKSSLELFFESMAQSVKRLPRKVQADIKMEICKIVTEAELKYSGRNVRSTQQFIAPPGMIPKLVLVPCNMIDHRRKKE